MAESGDTYSNEGDSYAPEGMGDDPGPLEHAQKIGHMPCAGAALSIHIWSYLLHLISFHVLAGVACLADVRANEQILHAVI